MMFSRKPAKNYFIDSENVNDVWVANIVNDLGKTDHIYIFYSENSTHMRSDSVRRLMELGSDRVTWIRCYIGTNAVDFQLVTVLGAVTSTGKAEDEFIIVSNDAGFDAVVQFWQDQGREVSRLKMDTSAGRPKRQNKRKPTRKIQSQKPDLTKQPVQQPAKQAQNKPNNNSQPKQNPSTSKPQPKQEAQKPQASKPQASQSQAKPQQQTNKQQPVKAQPAKQNNNPQSKQQTAKQQNASAQPKPQPKQTSQKQAPPQPPLLSARNQAIMKSVCRSIPAKDAGRLHDALNALLGAEDGMAIYNTLRKDAKLQQELSGLYLADAKARASNYIQLIYAVSGASERVGSSMASICEQKHAEGLQSINLAMVRAFGQEEAQKYYPDIKRHYRILEKIYAA